MFRVVFLKVSFEHSTKKFLPAQSLEHVDFPDRS